MMMSRSLTPRERLFGGYVAVVALCGAIFGPLYVTSDSYEFRRLLVDENQVVEMVTAGVYLVGVLLAAAVLLIWRARVHPASQLVILLMCVFALLEERSYFLGTAAFFTGNNVPIDTLHDINVAVADRFGVGVLLVLALVPLTAAIVLRKPVERILRRCSAVHPGWPYALIAVVLAGIALVVDAVEYKGTLPGGILLEELLELFAAVAMIFAAGAGLLVGTAPAAEPVRAEPEDVSVRREA